MDIQEIKTWAKNKIESDDLAKQVRRRIKETTWEKQNQREGFRESFKPLISQFEKPEDTKTKNIFTQNQEMLKNQLALTEGLRDNQRAITQGFNQFERLADMKELPSDGWERDWVPEPRPPNYEDVVKDLEKNFDGDEIKLLKEGDYPRPGNFNETNIKELEQKLIDVNNDIKELNGRITGRRNNKNPSPDYVAETNRLKELQGTLQKYRNTMNIYFNSINYKVGQGIYYSPQELLNRLELLGGSLAAGNNGVLSEYIQIAHRLRDLGVVTNNQLNALLRKYIDIR